jgi:hypothetical protein
MIQGVLRQPAGFHCLIVSCACIVGLVDAISTGKTDRQSPHSKIESCETATDRATVHEYCSTQCILCRGNGYKSSQQFGYTAVARHSLKEEIIRVVTGCRPHRKAVESMPLFSKNLPIAESSSTPSSAPHSTTSSNLYARQTPAPDISVADFNASPTLN